VEKEDSKDKTKESWSPLDEEKKSKLEIEKSPSWLPPNSPCIQENNKKRIRSEFNGRRRHPR